MRFLAARIANSSATSVWTWLLAFAPSVTTAVLHDRNLYGGSFFAWLAAAFAGALAAGTVLLLAHLLLPSPPPFAALVVVYALAGAARGLGVGGTAGLLGLVSDDQFVGRALSGAVLAMFWLSIASVIVDGFHTHRHTMVSLRQRETDVQSQLDAAERGLAALRSDTNTHIAESVRAQVEALVQVEDATPDTAARLSAVASALTAVAVDVVRPASHGALSPVPLHSDVSTNIGSGRRVALRAVATDTFRVSPFNPVWLIALLFPSILTTAVRAYGLWWGLLGAAWIVAMAGAVLAVARRTVTAHLARTVAPVRVLVVVVVWATAAIASTVPVLAAHSWGLGPDRAWAVFGVPLLAYVPITCFGIALAAAITSVWAMDEDRLASLLAELQWRTQRKEQSMWAERQRWARYLHGSVQSTLTSTSLLIDAGLADGLAASTIAQQAIERLTPLLVDGNSAAANELSGAESVDRALGRIASVWSRLSEIDLDLGDGVDAALARDLDAADATVEIAREGIANAIRHGHASRISVAVFIADTRSMQIAITDNGRNSNTSAQGMGSATLDDLCLDWSRDSTSESGTVLRCRIPLIVD